ncbi:MAG: T9SS type A sorting domain-containing protein, partial [Bacteroidota bacterium]
SGAALLSNSAVFDRPALSQTFDLNTNNLKFNFVVNHFKSKGGTGTGADADQGDGQAAFNDRRKKQATELLNFFTTTVIPASNNRIITVGDYNAYYEEDPMDILRAGTYRVLGSATSYSYLFEGQVGSLDHAVVSNSILSAVLSIEKWNANASEPTYLSYEDAIADGGGDVVNPWASTYTVSPWRASDHDAILLFLDLTPVNSPLPVKLTSFNAVKNNNSAKLTWSTSTEINAKEFIIERSGDGNNYSAIGRVNAAGNSNIVTNYLFTDNTPAQGNNFYRLRVVDVDAKFEFSRVIKIDFRKSYTVTVSPNPAKNTVYVSTTNAVAGLQLEIVNSSGSIVHRQTIQSGLSSINISALPKGNYVFRFTSGNEIFTEKIIKE